MEYLFVLAGGIASLFIVIMVMNKGKRAEHWFLTTLFVLIVAGCYYIFKVHQSDGVYYLAYYSEVNYALPLLYGLLLWFYTKSLISKNYRLKPKDLVHFLPFIGFVLYLILPLILGHTSDSKEHNGYPLVKLIVNPVYIFLTINMINNYRRKLKQEFSYEDHMHLFWLSWIAYGGLLLWIVACLGNIFNWFYDPQNHLLGDYFLTGFLGILMFILAYIGFNRTHIFQALEKPVSMLSEDQEDADVNLEEYDKQYNKILKVMTEKQPYLDQTLSLHKLADICGLSPNKLSTIINIRANANFYDFVNGYRVEAVKDRLLKEDLGQLTILGIAEESGFNSKASFNRIFKNVVGLTPTEYIRRNI